MHSSRTLPSHHPASMTTSAFALACFTLLGCAGASDDRAPSEDGECNPLTIETTIGCGPTLVNGSTGGSGGGGAPVSGDTTGSGDTATTNDAGTTGGSSSGGMNPTDGTQGTGLTTSSGVLGSGPTPTTGILGGGLTLTSGILNNTGGGDNSPGGTGVANGKPDASL